MAYAAVNSLRHTIDYLQKSINPEIPVPVGLDFLSFMLGKLDGKRGIDRSVINELDAKIRDAVWRVEDVLESYHFHVPPLDQGLDEKGVEQEIDSFLMTVNKLVEEYELELQNPLPREEDDAAVFPEDHDFGGSKSNTVGLSDLSQKIIDEILDESNEHSVFSLVGMAGIGKSHLATHVYQHPLIVQRFDSRLWVRVGPKDPVITDIYVDVLAQIESKPRDSFKEKSKIGLMDLLRKKFKKGRYFIVLDDIWSTQVLDHFTTLLPHYGKKSQILVTTRRRGVASRLEARWRQMPFLSNEDSWSLLWQNVFAEESYFPYELEKAGRKIAEKCEGLPLLILAVANILREHDMTREYWNKVADDKTTTFPDAYDQIYKVLSSSYEYLSQDLKPCFLYMGVFPQSYEIPASKLITLWGVENILEPGYKSGEDNAWGCLSCLFSESVAILCKKRFDRRRSNVKSLKLHSAFWHLCVTEARKSKFFHVLKKLTDVSKDYIESHRRLSVQNNVLFGINEVHDSMAAVTSSPTRSLLYTGAYNQYPIKLCLNMMLLMKVLDALAIRFYEFPEEVLQLLQLRYLSLTHNGELPSAISTLQHLQHLILRKHHNIILLANLTYLPEEIWDMKKLRHLRIMGSNLRKPSKGSKKLMLLKLYVNANSCTKDVLGNISVSRKLGITIELQPEAPESLSCLEHIGVMDGLESLKCVVVNPFKLVIAPPEHLSYLPKRLKKLSLNGLGYPWKYMSVIGLLPQLRVLKLRCYAFQGPHWETEAGLFKSLEVLVVEDTDLVHWTFQDEYCLPRLHHLIVRHCFKLKKIPLEIGDDDHIMKTLEVDDCSPSVVAYAHQIKEKTKSSNLDVVINSSWNF